MESRKTNSEHDTPRPDQGRSRSASPPQRRDDAIDADDTRSGTPPPEYEETPPSPAAPETIPEREPAPAPAPEPSPSQSKAKSPPSFFRGVKQAYEDKREKKEAQRTVDYYEKTYGFVPKNVMSQAEWRKARERAPKEEVSIWRRRRGNNALLLGGATFAGGGC